MKTHKSFWWRLGGSLVVASVLATGVVGGLSAQAKESTVAQELGGSLGVVDYNNLLKAHPDYERLQQFDDQLSGLKAEIEAIPLLERNDKMREAQERFKKEALKAQAEMEAESNAIAAEMNGMSAAMKAKLDALGNQRRAEMEQKIEAYIKKHGGPTADEPDAEPMNNITNVDQAKNLMLLRDRKRQAIQLEVEKAHREQVEAERARIDSEIAAYEDEVMRSHQQEKLNLQLKVQVAQDEAEQAELQAQLGAISDEEERLKDAKRAELEGGYKAFRAESDASQAAEIKQKQAAVDAEVKAQLGAIPDAPAPQQPRPRSAPKMSAELQALIKQETARLEAEMQAAAEDARRKMEAEQVVQMERLKSKQAELKKRMEKVQGDLKRVVEQTNTQGLSDATKEKIAVKQAQFDKLEEQRTELYDKMVADLKADIGAVAEKNKVDIVIGSYVYRDESRDDCTDLTDYAMVAIKTKARPDSP